LSPQKVENRARLEITLGNSLFHFIPTEAAKIILVLFLSFLVGLEREEHMAASEHYGFGGVRTFPLIGLFAYAMGLISSGNLFMPGIGLAVVGVFLWQSYNYKLKKSPQAGMTSEIGGLVIYTVGVLVYQEQYWIATTITVISVLLLELKQALENLTKRVPGGELLTFAKFLVLTAVILPVVPNRAIGSFGFNPIKTWLVVVAVSGISYGSYLLQKATHGQGGVMLSALIGGAYSSTLTTVVLAKRAKEKSQPHLFAGATLAACGMMYLRLLALLAIFNRGLFQRLAPAFLALTLVGVIGGWVWSRRRESGEAKVGTTETPGNPLELKAAMLFGLLFVAMLVITHFALAYLGRSGFYSLAALMGVTDVDPFILSLTQSAGTSTPLEVAAAGVTIAAASNNLVKGIYARSFSDKRTGLESLALLAAFALLGLLALAL
jgi:uncharacterized membrane protein (DUF4010 family)